MKPMLAEEIPTAGAGQYLTDPAWGLEQKADGHRVIIRVDNGHVTCLDRNGETKRNPVPRAVTAPFTVFTDGVWMFDGELVADQLWLFDLPVAADQVTPAHPLLTRRLVLEGLHQQWRPGRHIRVLPQARTTGGKEAAYRSFLELGCEGVILKNLNARYCTTGQRTTDVLKVKFVKTVDCFVRACGLDGHNNAELAVYDDDGEEVVIGRCSLNGKPAVRRFDVLEVRYLYVGVNGRLYQPRLMRVRDDKTAVQCSVRQLPARVDKTIHPDVVAGV